MTRYSFGKKPGDVMQMAWVATDLDAAIRHQVDVLGIGPWYLFDHFELLDLRYRGAPSDLDISLALSFSGDICVEIIQQHDDGPSVYRDLLGNGGSGFHHWGVASAEYERDIARYEGMGLPLVVDGRVAIGARAGYVDATSRLGAFIEIIEVTDDVDRLFQYIREQADGWDGADPLRRL